MTPSRLPRLPLPAPLKGTDYGSFAHHTVIKRMPDIARRVLVENDLPPDIAANVEALIADIPDALIRPLKDQDAPDRDGWQRAINPYLDHNWLEVPWFFAETYFYRRIVEATGYFQNGLGQARDPYIYQKRLGLESNIESISTLCKQLQERLQPGWHSEHFKRLLAIDLWGNQVDLSIWPAGEEGQPNHQEADQQQAHILANDSEAIVHHLEGSDRPRRVDFMIDNAGFELVCDLCLADYLLTTQMVATVCFHLKLHPTFVSDALIKDIHETVASLADYADECVHSLAVRLRAHIYEQRLILKKDPFWTSALDAWDMPPDLRQELAEADLVISKGDANYRRLLGDRHWPYTTPFADVVSYFPAPLAALRTLKSEVAIGMPAGRLQRLNENSPLWTTSGQWGVIQFTGA
jgi:uncharacterized protein with ATP-grasp and redox domains